MIRFLFLILFSSLLLSSDKVTLALEWKYQFQFAGYIAAKEKGFYSDAGFDVELLEYNGKDTVDMVLDKEAQFATSKSRVILDKMQGKEIVLIASFFKKSALVFVAQDGIRYPQQFINKKIMGTQGELTSSNLAILLNKFQILNNDFKFVPHTFNSELFINKEIDVMSAFISNELYHLDKVNYKYNVIDPANYGIYTYNENLITSLEYARKHPNKVRAFKKATIKGWKYALSHQEELIDIIYDKYSKQKSKEALSFEAQRTKQLIMPEVFELGYVDEAVIKNIADTFVQMRLNNKYYNLDNFIFDKEYSTHIQRSKILKLSDTEKKYLQEKESIKMCIDPHWMPFEGLEDGRYVGMGADYFQKIENILDKKIEVVKTSSWQESVEIGKNRECDIFSLVVDTPNKRKFLNFTQPILTFPLAVATKKDKDFILNLASIIDKPLSTVKEYSFTEIIKKKFPDANIVEVLDIDEGLSLVEHGKVYGHIDALHTLSYKIQKQYYNNLKISGRFNKEWELSIGIRNDNKTLLSIMNKASSLITKQQKQEILNNWLSIKFEKGFDYELLYKIVAIFIIIILFILFRYIVISKSNKKLKLLQDELNELNHSLQVRIDKEIHKSLQKDKFLQEQSKLAAMGEMVGAIAHQWRQPLNSLNINIQNLDDDYEDGLVNKRFIDNFISRQTKTIKFMSKTIDDFRNFFRVDKVKEEFSMLEAIHATINIQSAQLTNNNIGLKISGNDFTIFGFMSEFQQVILNLITNAKDALVENNIEQALIKIELSEKTVKIKDNAKGIPDDVLQRIFEPYFTTKAQGKGMGMGLYMSKMIIEQNMGAKLDVKSTKDGTKFSIIF